MSKRKMTLPSEEPLDAIESHLAGTLKPVAPRTDFVQRLRGRVHLLPREEIAFRLNDWRDWFFAFSGVISGALIILTVARAMFHLFGRRNIG
jgi:hypothetical protein